MLASSYEYLQALRAGKYLRFLEWPQFIQSHYYKDDKTADADELLTLLVFDWLNNGYCEEDAKATAILCAVYGMDSRPIRGNLDYSLTSLSGALFHSMVHQALGFQKKIINPEKKTRSEILAFMKDIMTSIDQSSFNSCLKDQQTQLFEWSDKVKQETLKEVCGQISAITAMRYLLEDFLAELERIKIDNDPLKLTRLSMANSLNSYLNEKTELTPDVSAEVVNYVNKIRQMQPSPIEEEYLNALAPLNLSENTWRIVTRIGISFFTLLQKPSAQVGVETDKPTI